MAPRLERGLLGCACVLGAGCAAPDSAPADAAARAAVAGSEGFVPRPDGERMFYRRVHFGSVQALDLPAERLRAVRAPVLTIHGAASDTFLRSEWPARAEQVRALDPAGRPPAP